MSISSKPMTENVARHGTGPRLAALRSDRRPPCRRRRRPPSAVPPCRGSVPPRGGRTPSEKSPRMIHSARAGKPRRARSSSIPRLRAAVSTLPAGPVTWAMRVWPSACRCRIASRAPSALSMRMTGNSNPSTHSQRNTMRPPSPASTQAPQRARIEAPVKRDHAVDPPVEEIFEKLPPSRRGRFSVSAMSTA